MATTDVVRFGDMQLPVVDFQGQVKPAYSEFRPMRLIGIELRMADRYNGLQEELMMLPLNMLVPSRNDSANHGRRDQFYMPCTLHTTEGDINFEIVF